MGGNEWQWDGGDMDVGEPQQDRCGVGGGMLEGGVQELPEPGVGGAYEGGPLLSTIDN